MRNRIYVLIRVITTWKWKMGNDNRIGNNDSLDRYLGTTHKILTYSVFYILCDFIFYTVITEYYVDIRNILKHCKNESTRAYRELLDEYSHFATGTRCMTRRNPFSPNMYIIN